ncbi:PucR family transcriptional regulator [Pseudonocardia sp. GCM10023141]|uniref:PucR family transcriptional regulator n=1 Tax=Pseudonocardia sp. GCM10023141 TaxID=3252653 RepID=UPI0036061252
MDRLLVRDRAVLVRSLIAALPVTVPAYGQLPAEELTGDIARAIETGLALFVDALRAGRLPGPEQLAALRDSAARRAEEGVPVEAVLTAYHVGVQAVWSHVAALATAADHADLMACSRLMLGFLQQVTTAVAGGYLEERQIMFGDEHAVRHALLMALLDGEPAEEAAQRARFRLPRAYLVLDVAIGPHPDETAPGVDATVAQRRKLRRVRTELDRHAREPVLTALSATGGTVLVPADVASDALTDQHWQRLAAVVEAMARAAGADVTVGAVAAEPTGVAAAAALAGEVRAVAVAFGRGPGLWRLDDVLLEYQLSRPTAASARLAALLAPLDDQPDLLATLAAYLRTGQNRRQTATALHVHPNTVDYRLRRVAAITGLDPTRAADVTRIEVGLAARAMGAAASRTSGRTPS